MTIDYFDERVAATYDDDAEMFEPAIVDPVVDFLFGLTGEGKALEFGVGPGRIALPLAGKGVSVHGIEFSRPMISRLVAKPGGSEINVSIGDFSTTVINDSFPLVYLVFNTIMNLTTQRAQIDCFRNAASHLGPGGAFVVEVMVPGLQKLPHGERLLAYELNERHWGVDEYDVATQGLVSHHVRVVSGSVERFSTPFRYVWPAELDLMAQMAGMTLRERWSDWRRNPFTNTSESHVSVWTKPLLPQG